MGLEFERVAPPSDLNPIVRDIWTLRGRVSGLAAAEPVLPDGYPEIVINRADPFCRSVGQAGWESQPAALLVGPQTTAAWIRPTGVVDLVGVRLQPWALGLVAGHPAHQLRNLLPGLGEVVGAATAGAFIDTADPVESLCRWLRLRWAGASTRTKGATARVAATVNRSTNDRRSVGVSPRQVERLFRDQAGLSPRAWRGLQTFQRAVRLKALHADWPWAQVATAAGYVDQAHLIREFRNYVGITPGRYATNGANLTSCFLDLDQIT